MTTATGMSSKIKFDTSTLITAEPMMNNMMTTEAYTSSNLSDSNSFNDSSHEGQRIKENNEFNLNDNNVEEKILMDNINNVLLNNSYENQNIQIQSTLSPSTNISSGIPTTLSFTPLNQNQKVFPSFNTTAVIPLSTPTSSDMTLSQSIIPAKTLVTPPPPPLFMATDSFSLQSKKFNNDSFFTQAFDPVINSNFSIPNFNPTTTNSSINSMEKVNPMMPMPDSKDKPNFTPFITSEGLINNHLQIRLNKGLSNSSKNEKNDSFNYEMGVKKNTTAVESRALSLNDLINSTINDGADADIMETGLEDDLSENSTQTIKNLKHIIQNLTNKCMEYDERLKEALQYNKQLETKIFELEKKSPRPGYRMSCPRATHARGRQKVSAGHRPA